VCLSQRQLPTAPETLCRECSTYKNQVLKRDEVFPHSLNIFFCFPFIRHNFVLQRDKYFISSLFWIFAIKITISKGVAFVFPGAVFMYWCFLKFK
jgi:hypothetical protein